MINSLNLFPTMSSATLGDLLNELNGMFETRKRSASEPNYYTSHDGNEVFVELPGCKKEDIDVEAVPGKGIVITAKREIAGEKSSYRLTLSTKGDIDFDDIHPSYADGILSFKVKDKKSEVRKLSVE